MDHMNVCFVATPLRSQLSSFVPRNRSISSHESQHTTVFSRFHRSSSNSSLIFMGRRSEKIAVRKGKQELIRSKLFSRVGKQIITAVKQGSSDDPEQNKALAFALEQANKVNFPKDNITRLLQRANSTDQQDYKSSIFEIYGYGNTGILIEVFTDNTNRAVSDIRTVLNRANVSLASAGSVSFNYEKYASIRIVLRETLMELWKNGESDRLEEEILMNAIEAGAQECELCSDDDDDEVVFEVLTNPLELMQVVAELEKCSERISVQSSRFVMVPKSKVNVSPDEFNSNMKLMDALENLDDVDCVFHNMECDQSNHE